MIKASNHFFRFFTPFMMFSFTEFMYDVKPSKSFTVIHQIRISINHFLEFLNSSQQHV